MTAIPATRSINTDPVISVNCSDGESIKNSINTAIADIRERMGVNAWKISELKRMSGVFLGTAITSFAFLSSSPKFAVALCVIALAMAYFSHTASKSSEKESVKWTRQIDLLNIVQGKLKSSEDIRNFAAYVKSQKGITQIDFRSFCNLFQEFNGGI